MSSQRSEPGKRLRVFVTGAGGFVGRHVVRELTGRGHTVVALVHRQPVGGADVIDAKGDLYDPATYDDDIRGCDAVIHLVGIIKETGEQTFEHVHVDGTTAVLAAAKSAGVRRVVYLSALGATAESASRYATTKFAAEQAVKAAGVDWTLFRPSMIVGPDGEFVKMVVSFARGESLPYAFMPYFGVGLTGYTPKKIQPIDVLDVARAVADAVEGDGLVGQTVNLVGSQVVDWRQLYQVIGEAATPRPRPIVGLPAWYGRAVAAVVPNAWLPFNTSQVVMAAHDNVADVAETARQLGWTPQAFAPAFRESWAAAQAATEQPDKS